MKDSNLKMTELSDIHSASTRLSSSQAGGLFFNPQSSIFNSGLSGLGRG